MKARQIEGVKAQVVILILINVFEFKIMEALITKEAYIRLNFINSHD
jgi:hypothetical protein